MDAEKSIQAPKPIALAEQVNETLASLIETVSEAYKQGQAVFSLVRDVETALGVQCVSETAELLDQGADVEAEAPRAGILPGLTDHLQAVEREVAQVCQLSRASCEVLAEIKAQLACPPGDESA